METFLHIILCIAISVIILAILRVINYYEIHGIYSKPIKVNNECQSLENYEGSMWNLRILDDPYNTVTIKIGCKENTIQFWDDFFSEDESKHLNREYYTDRNTVKFKRIRKDYCYVRKQALKYLNSK